MSTATSPSSPSSPRPSLSLRERKKLLTRQRLVTTALEMFTEHGFDGATLHDLCEAVEVSERTFFRNFTSKEDAALAPGRDLWTACLGELETRSPGDSTLLGFLQDGLLAALDRTGDEGWTRQLLLSQRLAERTPSMDAQARHFCDRTTRSAMAILYRRLELPAPDDLGARLALDMLVASFNQALGDWGAQAGTPGADDLARHVRAAFAVLPGLPGIAYGPRPA
ncbi:TetR/AcrR family transcriptional regulator [Nocardiopsis sp. ARC36]